MYRARGYLMGQFDDDGQSKVRMKKDQLLTEVKKNRAAHETEYKAAEAAYRVDMLQRAEQLVADIKEGRTISRSDINELAEPASHLKDYDRVIRMLEFEVSDEVVLSETQFSHYVLDEWGWSQHFKAIAATYNASPGRRR